MANDETRSLSADYSTERLRHFLRAAHRSDIVDISEVCQPAGQYGGLGIPRLTIVETQTYGTFGRTDFGAGPIKDATFGPGQFVVFPYGCARTITVLDEHVLRLFEPEPSLLLTVFDDATPGPATLDLGCLHMRMIGNPNITAILSHLWQEASTGNLAWRLATESAVVALGVALLRAKARLERTADRAGIGAACDWRVRRVMDRMEDEIGSDIGLQELASGVGLSAAHFRNVFVAVAGVPPYRWLLHRRIVRAGEMLARTNRSVTDIALACGFSSSQHFATAFKARQGCTPTDHRNSRNAIAASRR